MNVNGIITGLGIAAAMSLAPLMGGELLISRHAAKVLPHRMVSVPADMAGELEVCHFGGKGLKEGTLLARLNVREYELSLQDLEHHIRKNELESDGELLKLQREKEELTFISSLDPKQRPFVEQRIKKDVDTRSLELLERKIEQVRKGLELANQKLRLDFDRRWKAAIIKMPFDGVAQYHVTLPEKEGGSILVTSGTPIVTLADDSKLYVAVVLTEPELARLDAERFTVRVTLGRGKDGEELTGVYAFRRVEKQGQNEQPVYYFEIPDEQKEAAWKMVGANLIAALHYQDEADWLYVPKRELAAEAGENNYDTWDELAAKLRPGYELVFCGETHICLRPRQAKTP